MENVILVIHLILALSLIGAVLMQRSEGGMGSMGGGAGGGGSAGGRAPATVMGKFTWIIAAAFIATSIALTIVAAQQSAGASVVDRLSELPVADDGAATPDLGENLLPPSSDDAPLVPSGN